MKGIIPLASYPKSGNTWMRLLLTALHTGRAELDKEIEGEHVASRRLVDSVLGVETSELTPEEIHVLRPLALAEYYRRSEQDRLYLKTHDAFLSSPDGGPVMLPLDTVPGAIHIVRDPRDVAVSFAHHGARSVDSTIKKMSKAGNYLVGDGLPHLSDQLPQFMSSWSRHTESWMDKTPFPVLTVRYEDLRADPVTYFSQILDFAGEPATKEQIHTAVAACSFDKLQAQEKSKGFRERLEKSQSFFRRGIAGGWRDSLSPEQVEKIEADHRPVMERLGYL